MLIRTRIKLFVLGAFILATGLAVLLGGRLVEKVIVHTRSEAFRGQLGSMALHIEDAQRELNNASILQTLGFEDVTRVLEMEKQAEVLDYLQSQRIGHSGRIFVVDQEARVIQHPAAEKGQLLAALPLEQIWEQGAGHFNFQEYGESWFAAFLEVPEWKWILILAISEQELYAHKNSYFGLIGASTLLSGTLLVLIFHMAFRKVNPRFTRMIHDLEEIRDGDYEKEVEVGEHDEIGLIQQTMKSMLQNVRMRTRELESARQKAEYANQSKSRFLANISHELRTPLNAILGFSEMLAQSEETSPAQYEKLAIINRSGTHLLDMINDVLDLSKIEAGRTELEIKAFNLPEMLYDLSRLFEVRALQAGLDFRVELHPELAKHVETDCGKLRQILINLLGNAVKFTPCGEVVLSARTLPDASDPAQLILQAEVRDSGPGIKQTDLEHIFDPFVQVHSTDSPIKGTGLGLAITKSYIECLGGSIRALSPHEKGAVFHLELPIRRAEAEEIKTSVKQHPPVIGLAPDQPQWRILIVEDHPENLLLLSTQLKRAGLTLRTATNGEQGIEQFKQWEPHLIWMDMQMPVLDGYEATRIIRTLPRGQDVKIIALTASAFKMQEEKIYEAGCTAVLHKPYPASALFETMERELGIRFLYQEEAAPPKQAERPRPPRTDLFDVLSPKQRDQLKDAALQLNAPRIQQLAEEISPELPTHAQQLQQLAANFQFGEILTLLRHKVEHHA